MQVLNQHNTFSKTSHLLLINITFGTYLLDVDLDALMLYSEKHFSFVKVLHHKNIVRI